MSQKNWDFRLCCLDNNGNNRISLVEFVNNALLFNRFDQDENGMITPAELANPR